MKAGPAILLTLAVWLLLGGVSQGADGSVETRHLSVRDATGRLPNGQLQALAERAQATLERMLELWGVDAQTESLGKIRVIYEEPLRGHCTSLGSMGGDRTMRSVRVFGCVEAPLMLAHKLTNSLMPQPDKLLRNMAGAISEERVGDPGSFPACTQDVDDWVRSFARSGTLIPLRELGPDHGSWGMKEDGGGRLMAFDRVRQQRAYAEAGSFARYLAATHGLDSLKRLTRLSRSQARPWRAALGADLEELEAGWLEALRAGAAGREERVGRLIRVMSAGAGPGLGDPCARARVLGQ